MLMVRPKVLAATAFLPIQLSGGSAIQEKKGTVSWTTVVWQS